jgi:glyoxylase I family protein
MQIESIDHAALNVRDMERARPFYEGILGLRRADRPEMGLPGAWYQIGQSQLHLIQTPEGVDVGTRPESLSPIAGHLALRVDDFEAARKRFAEHDIEALDLGPEGDQFWVRDPDGNTIEITRR